MITDENYDDATAAPAPAPARPPVVVAPVAGPETRMIVHDTINRAGTVKTQDGKTIVVDRDAYEHETVVILAVVGGVLLFIVILLIILYLLPLCGCRMVPSNPY